MQGMKVERHHLQAQTCAGGLLKLVPLLANRGFEWWEGAYRHAECAHRRNSSVISAVCSPMAGAGFTLLRMRPSMRIGQRVVRNTDPPRQVTSCTISSARKASLPINWGHVRTSAHQ